MERQCAQIEFNGFAGRGFGLAAGRSPLWKNVLVKLASVAAAWLQHRQDENGGRTMSVEVELLKLLPGFFNTLDSLIENCGVYLYNT